MAKRAFGELELQILNIIKDKSKLTIKEVHQKLGGRDNYNTIMTVMNRLVDKKQLLREKKGLQYEYWIVESNVQLPSFLEKIKQKFIGVETYALVSQLIESDQHISDEELDAIEKLIQKKRKTT